MAEKHLTIKVTLTGLTQNRFRSRVEQSPLGASKGPGCDFELSEQELKDIRTQAGLIPAAKVSRDDLVALGKRLFNYVFSGEVGSRYKSCVAIAGERGERLRIALTVLAEELLAVPWEYMHDGESFILKQGQTIVRVIDELKARKAPFGPIRRLLVAIANPKNSMYEEFDAEGHRKELEALIGDLKGVDPDFLMPATKKSLRVKLSDNDYDTFYFIGHGRFSPGLGGQIILEKPPPAAATEPSAPATDDDKLPTDDPLDADVLAQWLTRGPSGEGVRLVYLNSCSTTATGEENPFSGVAQRLMRDGEVAAAVAMQTNVGQTSGMDIAAGFFEELRRGGSPEQAVARARTRADDYYSWGIPVIYSQLSGPEEFEKNRIAYLLNAKIGKSTYGVFLPTFRRGIPLEDYDKISITLAPPNYSYKGQSFSRRDTEAAWCVIDLLTKIAPHDDIGKYSAADHARVDCTHWFLFGSKSNDFVNSVLNRHDENFRFEYGRDKWVLQDKKYGHQYTIDDPSEMSSGKYAKVEDYGAIEKISTGLGRVFFLFSGLGDRATHGCGWYFMRNWEKLLEKFGGEDFGIILRFPEGHDFQFAEPIDRETGPPVTP